MLSIILLALLPLALAVPTTAPSGSCAQVGIITARASTEAPGEGIIGTLAAAIQSSSTQTVSRTAVDYPAVLEPYAPSVASGVAAMTGDLEAAVKACPDQKIVLLGYS
jgi:acetylxylan esterase